MANELETPNTRRQTRSQANRLLSQALYLSVPDGQCNTGGAVFMIDDQAFFNRFLCLGSANGTFYTVGHDEDTLGQDVISCIQRLLRQGRGIWMISKIRRLNGVMKNKPLLLALAICISQGSEEVKQQAYEVMVSVCVLPTDLFMFIGFLKTTTTANIWNKKCIAAVTKWYNNYPSDGQRLAYHVTKYPSRNGWSHKDVLRCIHVKPRHFSVHFQAIFCYITKKIHAATRDHKQHAPAVVSFLQATEQAKMANRVDVDIVAGLIQQNRLAREHVSNELLREPVIWKALLPHMPYKALIRNLGKMGSQKIGLLQEGSDESREICAKLRNVAPGDVHPFDILIALKIYESGQGEMGQLRWPVNRQILQGLQSAFYASFQQHNSNNSKRFCVAVNTSAAMRESRCLGATCISPMEAAAAMCSFITHTAWGCQVVAFSTGNDVREMNFNNNAQLNDIMEAFDYGPISDTPPDCSLPFKWAMERHRRDANEGYDVFVVFTDNEPAMGTANAADALQYYRQETGVCHARLIVCAMTCSAFTISDPTDRYMMHMAGFSAEAPRVIANFANMP